MYVTKEIDIEIDVEDLNIDDIFDYVIEICNKRMPSEKEVALIATLKDELGFNAMDHIPGLVYAMDRDSFHELVTIVQEDYKYQGMVS